MTTPLPVHMFTQPVKYLSNFQWMTGCVGRCPISTSPSQKGIPPGTLTILASSEINLSNLPGHPDGMGCMLRGTVRVQRGHRMWSPDPAKLNHSFSRVARRNLPTAPPSRSYNQDQLRRWERAACEQTIMRNQAAGLSRCSRLNGHSA